MTGDYDATPTDGATLNDYVNVIRRRKWLIVLVAVLAFIVGILISAQQETKYSATAHVIEPRPPTTAGSAATQLQRSAEAEASLARAPAIAEDVIETLDLDMTTEEFLSRSSVTSAPDSDVLEFTVRAADAALAVNLVNTYTQQFNAYRTELASTAFEEALSGVKAAIDETEDALVRARARGTAGAPRAALLAQEYQELLDEQQRLFSQRAVVASSAVPIPAERAVRLGPHPLRSGLLGLAFGLVLGIALAFGREAVDPRVRRVDEIGDRLGLPLLARVPPPPRPLAWQGKLVMLEDPGAPEAEAFRVLRTNLDFANMPFGGRTVMLTSASEGEGRTTTLANLGITLARSGRSVILADLDLRHPELGLLFNLENSPGLTDVAVGRLDLDDALVTIPLTNNGAHGLEGEEWGEVEGVLEVLPAGSLPPDPGDFVGTESLTHVLGGLANRGDVVLIDSPPLLAVADAVTLSAKVDALVIAIPVDARRSLIDELRRILDVCPAPKLGYVVTGVETRSPYPRDPNAHRMPAADEQRRSRRPVGDRSTPA